MPNIITRPKFINKHYDKNGNIDWYVIAFPPYGAEEQIEAAKLKEMMSNGMSVQGLRFAEGTTRLIEDNTPVISIDEFYKRLQQVKAMYACYHLPAFYLKREGSKIMITCFNEEPKLRYDTGGAEAGDYVDSNATFELIGDRVVGILSIILGTFDEYYDPTLYKQKSQESLPFNYSINEFFSLFDSLIVKLCNVSIESVEYAKKLAERDRIAFKVFNDCLSKLLKHEIMQQLIVENITKNDDKNIKVCFTSKYKDLFKFILSISVDDIRGDLHCRFSCKLSPIEKDIYYEADHTPEKIIEMFNHVVPCLTKMIKISQQYDIFMAEQEKAAKAKAEIEEKERNVFWKLIHYTCEDQIQKGPSRMSIIKDMVDKIVEMAVSDDQRRNIYGKPIKTFDSNSITITLPNFKYSVKIAPTNNQYNKFVITTLVNDGTMEKPLVEPEFVEITDNTYPIYEANMMVFAERITKTIARYIAYEAKYSYNKLKEG